jgi:hypothetical protein
MISNTRKHELSNVRPQRRQTKGYKLMQKFFSILLFKDKKVLVKSDKHLTCCSSTRNKNPLALVCGLELKWQKTDYLQNRCSLTNCRQITSKRAEKEAQKQLFYSFRITWICNQLEFLKNIRNSKGTQTTITSTKLSRSHNGNPRPFCEQQGTPLYRNNTAHCVLGMDGHYTPYLFSTRSHLYQ